MTKEIKIGNRNYIVEENPIGNVEIKEPLLVVRGFNYLLQLDYSWECGWIGTPENKQYTTCKVSELNGTNWFHTSTNELYRVLKTDSTKLNSRYALEPLNF